MKILYILTLILLTSCATHKTMQASGGSKADGTVQLSYEYGMFEEPVVDYTLAQATAKKRCGAWGYSDADPFDTGITTCQAYNGYGNCVSNRVTVTYQCLN